MKERFDVSEQWKKEELQRIQSLENNELVEETILSAGGDDYDGCFTLRGGWTNKELIKELSLRLNKNRFIDTILFKDETK